MQSGWCCCRFQFSVWSHWDASQFISVSIEALCDNVFCPVIGWRASNCRQDFRCHRHIMSWYKHCHHLVCLSRHVFSCWNFPEHIWHSSLNNVYCLHWFSVRKSTYFYEEFRRQINIHPLINWCIWTSDVYRLDHSKNCWTELNITVLTRSVWTAFYW